MSKKSDGVQGLLASVVSNIVAHDELESLIVQQFKDLMLKPEDQGGLTTFEKIKVLEILKKEKAKNIGAVLGYLKQNSSFNFNLFLGADGKIQAGDSPTEERNITPPTAARLDLKSSANVLNFLRKAEALTYSAGEPTESPEAEVIEAAVVETQDDTEDTEDEMDPEDYDSDDADV
jgi:hypothetical protein